MSSSDSKEKKWKDAVESSVDITISGVRSTTKNPIKSIIANKNKMLSNFETAVNSGKWEENLLKYSNLKDWKSKTIIGYEKNRKIKDHTVNKMRKYYDSLDKVFFKISDVVNFIINNNDIVMPPIALNPKIVKQNVSSGLTKYQKKVKNIIVIEIIVKELKDFLVSKFNYRDIALTGKFSLQYHNYTIHEEAIYVSDGRINTKEWFNPLFFSGLPTRGGNKYDNFRIHQTVTGFDIMVGLGFHMGNDSEFFFTTDLFYIQFYDNTFHVFVNGLDVHQQPHIVSNGEIEVESWWNGSRVFFIIDKNINLDFVYTPDRDFVSPLVYAIGENTTIKTIIKTPF